MDKKLIVIVDTDEEYLAPLEYKFIEEWDENAEIEVITQLKYFNEFFSQPRNIFLLVINEFLYNEKIQKQNCRHVFVLREDEMEAASSAQEKKVQSIYKYSSIRELYAEVMKNIRIDMELVPVDHTRLYVVYSTCGGSGKTVSALGISSALNDLGKRVLYINTETYQDFNFYLEDKRYASPSLGYGLATGEKNLANHMLSELGNEEFDFLRPFEKTPLSYQITEGSYLELIEQVRQLKKYDVIVLEISQELSRDKLRLMEQADRVINICMATEIASYKNEKLLANINCREDKWVFVCNRYQKEEENYLSDQLAAGIYTITEYVEEQEKPLDLDTIRKKGIFDTTAYLLE